MRVLFCPIRETEVSGLENAEFVRLGTVHRNTFIDSPKCLDSTLQCRKQQSLFFAGQFTGTEGYVESTAGGFIAGINAGRLVKGQQLLSAPGDTALGSLLLYISEPERVDFQPMNISFGLMPSYLNSPNRAENGKKIPKKDRRTKAAEQALRSMAEFTKRLKEA